MSELTNIFSSLATSIRDITGSTSQITPLNMPGALADYANDSKIPKFFTSPVSMVNLFKGCTEFNTPVSFVESTYNNMRSTFSGCEKFNQSFIAPNTSLYAAYLFYNCYSLNCPIILGSSINNVTNAFGYCNSFGSNIYFLGNVARTLDTRNLLWSTNNQLRKNLYFNSVLSSNFTAAGSTSVVGAAITWTDFSDGNGFYNEAYNIYCYNNFSGLLEDIN